MHQSSKIYVAGHQGLLGSSLLRALHAQGYNNTILRSFAELDLRHQQSVHDFFDSQRPEYVFLCAAKVGGIKANSDYQAEFIYDNIMIQTNIIHAAWKAGVKKLLFLGSSCIYPCLSAQPIVEEALLTGPLEPTNQAYAVAKISGIVMAQAYRHQYGMNIISAMPTNLYGPYDTFDENASHVIPALILKIMNAHTQQQQVCELWGSGRAQREFLYVDDCATALIKLMQVYDDSHPINVGYGEDISISNLALMIAEIIGYKGEIYFNTLYPDGTPKKLLDSTKIRQLGWQPSVDLQQGLRRVIKWYKKAFRTIIVNKDTA